MRKQILPTENYENLPNQQTSNCVIFPSMCPLTSSMSKNTPGLGNFGDRPKTGKLRDNRKE